MHSVEIEQFDHIECMRVYFHNIQFVNELNIII